LCSKEIPKVPEHQITEATTYPIHPLTPEFQSAVTPIEEPTIVNRDTKNVTESFFDVTSFT
jgi:hypothetical protein